MTVDLWVLFAVVAALGANSILMALPIARRSDTYFWAVNGFNVLMGSLILGFGLPGFGHLPPPADTLISLMVGGMFFFHVAQFFNHRARWAQEARIEAREARRAERDAAEE
ncbi:MAG: hypothetical protein AAGA48_30220 [Myxococcota bacterium]